MWVSIASDAECAAALQQALVDYGIFDTESLKAVLHFGAAGFARALCTALQAEPEATDTAVLTVATMQTGMAVLTVATHANGIEGQRCGHVY